MVALHLGLEDDFIVAQRGRPGVREGGEDGRVAHQEAAVEADLGEADLRRWLPLGRAVGGGAGLGGEDLFGVLVEATHGAAIAEERGRWQALSGRGGGID